MVKDYLVAHVNLEHTSMGHNVLHVLLPATIVKTKQLSVLLVIVNLREN